jgi:hypothetical protein
VSEFVVHKTPKVWVPGVEKTLLRASSVAIGLTSSVDGPKMKCQQA